MLMKFYPKLYAPTGVPTTAYRTKYITISALMLPKHTGTSYFRFYKRYYNSKTRKYYYSSTPSFTKTAKVASSGSYAKIYLTLKMPYTGVYIARPYHSDSNHAPYVGPSSRTMTVR